jgi:hypothetical protein
MIFEEEYKRHAFSDLVWIGMVFARFVRQFLDRRHSTRRPIQTVETTEATLPL